jgi:hypothetical protein
VVASSCDLEKFCTLPDHVCWYDESCTTSLHRHDDKTTISPSRRWVATDGSHDIRDLHNQLC